MLPTGDRPRALGINLLSRLLRELLPNVRTHRVGEQRDRGHRAGVLVDQRCLAFRPRREELGGGRCANQARVRHACEAHAGDVPRGGIDAVEVPDRLRRAALELAGWRASGRGGWTSRRERGRTEEAAAVLELEDPRVAPGHLLEWGHYMHVRRR